MRLVTWNCKMAAHRKLQALQALEPDVVVLQECASPRVKAAAPVYAAATSYAWAGRNHTKGLAVLAFRGATIEGPPPVAEGDSIVAQVRCGPLRFGLLALWARGAGYRAYVEAIGKELERHWDFLSSGECVVAGDFNSNQRWDSKTRGGHARLVHQLEGHGLVSAYHQRFQEKQGEETRPTFFQYHHEGKPAHLDYLFVPRAWAERTRVEVPGAKDWLALSDHIPLVASVQSPLEARGDNHPHESGAGTPTNSPGALTHGARRA